MCVSGGGRCTFVLFIVFQHENHLTSFPKILYTEKPRVLANWKLNKETMHWQGFPAAFIRYLNHWYKNGYIS